jgi:hypothetical protein
MTIGDSKGAELISLVSESHGNSLSEVLIILEKGFWAFVVSAVVIVEIFYPPLPVETGLW